MGQTVTEMGVVTSHEGLIHISVMAEASCQILLTSLYQALPKG